MVDPSEYLPTKFLWLAAPQSLRPLAGLGCRICNTKCASHAGDKALLQELKRVPRHQMCSRE